MKRINKPRLILRTETVRALERQQLVEIAGGISGLRCQTITTCHESGGPCGGNSVIITDC